MTIYRPFLKTAHNELNAALSSEGIGSTIQPVWELIPAGSGLPMTTLVGRLSDLPEQVPWRIDARYVDEIDQSSISVLDSECRVGGVRYIPVIGPSSKPDDLVAAVVAVAHHRCGLTVRIPSPTGPANVDQAAATVRSLGLRPAQADLVIDCGFIADELTASLTAGRLLIPIHRALTQRWRSVTVLSGAFPSDPTSAAGDPPLAIPRHDAAAFRQLPFAVDFGDFGVAHALASSADDDAQPSLRWNRGDDWVMYGPDEIDTARLPPTGRFAAGLTTPSQLSDWAEWSTSHHLATVRQRLDRNAA